MLTPEHISFFKMRPGIELTRNFSFCITIAGSLFYMLLTGCSDKVIIEKTPEVDAKLALTLVSGISVITPRGNGTEKTDEAIKYIKGKAEKYGADVHIDTWKSPTPQGMVEFNNVIAEIPGQQKEFIILGSHYDTKALESVPDFTGANDSGSSTGLLLAMIDAIKKSDKTPFYTLVFVFFDGEECFLNYTENDGLFGSRHYVKILKEKNRIKQCKAAIILDMVGDKDLNITLPTDSHPGLSKRLLSIAKNQHNNSFFGWYRSAVIDDHSPFQDAGIPAIDVIDFEFGPYNRYWHTSADTIDKISKKSLKIVGDAVLQLVWESPELLK